MGTILKYNISATLKHFDKAISPEGQRKTHEGCDQTRRFTECFVRNIKIPFDEFSLLDVGCALGDAVPVLHKSYPKVRIYGCDVSEIGIDRCKKDHGTLLNFSKRDSKIYQVSGM